MVYLLFVLGVVLLVVGAEALVRGASRLAVAVGITPLVVGLTVVAFGTSAPELTVTTTAALQGSAGSEMAIGNVVGSNIFNVLFILGISATITPLLVAQTLVRFEVPVMIGLSALLYVLALDGGINRLEGLLFFTGIIIYMVMAIRQGRRESRAIEKEYLDALEEVAPREKSGRQRIWLQLLLIVGGLALLVVGSRWLVEGAVFMAAALGVSELVISLTIVAAGTSLPEVATSVMASIRGERDIAVGNVVGSCIFNLLAVLGLTAMIVPDPLLVPNAAIGFDLPIMIATAVACLPIFFTGHKIGRREGLLFLGYYVAYVAYLIMASTQHEALPRFNAVMLYFAVPLTGAVLLVAVGRQWFRRNRTR